MRELIRTIVSLFGYIFLHNHDSKIIYYHDVECDYTMMGTSLSTIKKHIDIARKSGYSFVNNISERKGQIQVCFDDGWKGLYDYKDFFLDQHIYPTVFIAVDLIGKEGYMTKEQIQELAEKGFLFEGHTWSHVGLTGLSDEQLSHELVDSKTRLEEMFGKSFTSICFPLGFFNDKVINASLEAGYTELYSSVCGGFYDLADKNIICRNLMQCASSFRFRLSINGRSSVFTRMNLKHQYLQSHTDNKAL